MDDVPNQSRLPENSRVSPSSAKGKATPNAIEFLHRALRLAERIEQRIDRILEVSAIYRDER